MADSMSTLTWKIKFSLLTNPNIVKSWLKAMGWTYVLCMVVLVPVFIATGESSGIPMILVIFAGVVFCLAILGFLIMLLILGNRSYARFTLSDKTILYENLDTRIKTLSRASVLAGGFFGSPATAGGGLLNISNEAVSIKWESIAKAVYDSKHHTICLRNSYRELLHLYCSSQNFRAVKRFVQTKIARHQTIIDKTLDRENHSPPGKNSQTFRPVTQTALIIIVSMSLFALSDITHLNILIPLIIMVFSLSMIWIIPIFGWVVLIMEGYLVFRVTSDLLLLSNYKLVSTYSFRKYEILDTGEWTVLSLAVIGLIYLAWASIKSINGKTIPVIDKD